MKMIKKIALGTLAITSLALTISTLLVSKNEYSIAYGYINHDSDTYYSNISDSLRDRELLTALRSLNSEKLKKRVGYDNMPSKFTYTDPGTSSNQVTSFYSGKSAKYSGNMNREHVWPASRTVLGRDKDPLEDDIHMIRPTLKSENEDRGNAFYVEGKNIKDSSWDPANCGNASYRGDSARIIFYCVIADSQLGLVDKDSDSSKNHTMGKLSDLLKWNLEYPVASRENTRNEEAEYLQGNRNPFIDHPEYACRIWGNTNATTKEICGGSGGGEITNIVFNEHTKTMETGKLFRLSVTTTPSNLDEKIVWSSSEPSVASIGGDGLITTLKAGTTTIVASNDDYTIFDKCVLTVINGSSGSNSGCGGNVITTSAILSVISLFGISLILLKKCKEQKDE